MLAPCVDNGSLYWLAGVKTEVNCVRNLWQLLSKSYFVVVIDLVLLLSLLLLL
jgi:hypothetical protein